MRRLSAALLLAMPIVLVAFAACGGGSDDDGPTPTSAPAATAEPTSSQPSDAIRELDLESLPVVASFVDQIGGTYVQANVLYADVTGDRIEDAVVPLSSGGTLGDVGFLVVTLEGDDVVEALSVDAREFGVSVRVDGDTLVSVEPAPGPDDPECCPSQIRTTRYSGDGGTGLTEESSVIEDNPAGGPKSPSPVED